MSSKRQRSVILGLRPHERKVYDVLSTQAPVSVASVIRTLRDLGIERPKANIERTLNLLCSVKLARCYSGNGTYIRITELPEEPEVTQNLAKPEVSARSEKKTQTQTQTQSDLMSRIGALSSRVTVLGNTLLHELVEITKELDQLAVDTQMQIESNAAAAEDLRRIRALLGAVSK